jgi:hypothetical protein
MANVLRRHRCSITANYIPGASNETADTLSRMGKSAEYFVTMTDLTAAIAGLGQRQLTLDAFASKDTKRLPKYCTLDRHDAEAWAVDGLTVDWSQERVLLHPPPTLILRTLKKIARERPTGILLLPNWRGQSWSPIVKGLQMSCVDLGSYQTVTRRTELMKDKGWLLPPGNLVAYGLGTRTIRGRSSSTSSPGREDCPW